MRASTNTRRISKTQALELMSNNMLDTKFISKKSIWDFANKENVELPKPKSFLFYKLDDLKIICYNNLIEIYQNGKRKVERLSSTETTKITSRYNEHKKIMAAIIKPGSRIKI